MNAKHKKYMIIGGVIAAVIAVLYALINWVYPSAVKKGQIQPNPTLDKIASKLPGNAAGKDELNKRVGK